jgi:tyrosyl-tRNA synthetase
MTEFRSKFLRTLDRRGYVHQITDSGSLDALARSEIVSGYIGFDATAPSLHVGSLVQIMMLRHLQQAGHKPIVLMGGGTTRVGDPSGKDESRRLLRQSHIRANINSITRVFRRFLTFGNGPTDAVIINNSEWLDNLKYIPFLRRVGRHFTINRMLNYESVKLRLDREQPLSFLEFNYMILQAYDFMQLWRRQGCRLQMGGSDQWGNIINGIDLTRRMEGEELYGVTTPLITTADGGKMGKTALGAVWLDAGLCSAYEYWQFWRNTADADVGRFLRLFTDVPLARIDALTEVHGSQINRAKIVLANAATSMLHGAKAAKAAEATARRTFEEGGTGAELPSLVVDDEVDAIEALLGLQLVQSKGEAKRHIAAGAVRANNFKIDAETGRIRLAGSAVKLSVGKKKHGVLLPRLTLP